MAGQLTLRVITPDRIVLDTTASSVRVPGLDGSIGVLPRHAPMVAALGPGALTFEKDGAKQTLFVAGGFAEVRDDTVRVVSPAGELPSEIDVERAKQAAVRARERLQARARPAGDAPALDELRAEAALRRALMRIQVKTQYQ